MAIGDWNNTSNGNDICSQLGLFMGNPFFFPWTNTTGNISITNPVYDSWGFKYSTGVLNASGHQVAGISINEQSLGGNGLCAFSLGM